MANCLPGCAKRASRKVCLIWRLQLRSKAGLRRNYCARKCGGAKGLSGRRKRMRNSLLIALLFFAHVAAAQSPSLHRVSPLAVPAGKTTEVKLIGERLGEITDLWCSAANVRPIPTNDARLF